MTVPPQHRLFGIWLLLALLVWAVFARTVTHDFIHFDDPEYITQNPMVRSGLTAESVAWAFTTFENSNWHPLTWLSHMLDVELFGLWPGGHHLVQVLLHTLTTLILFTMLGQTTGRPAPSALVAALFAVHPLHVESVAWAAERKDVLCALFSVLALWRYGRWARDRRDGKGLSPAVTVYFLLALLSKPMAVSLPLVMLLMDFWPLGRFPSPSGVREVRGHPLGRLVREKLPLFLLSGGVCAVTLAAQSSGGSVESLTALPMSVRIAHAPVAFLWYVSRTLWPVRLAVFYPHPGMPPLWAALGALCLLVAATAAAAGFRRRLPYLLTGWLWFLIMLLPVIGIIQVGEQAVADRYAYLPQVGLLVAGVWGLREAATRLRLGLGTIRAAAVLATLACAAAGFVQAGYWSDSATLFQRSLRVAGGSVKMHNNLALVFMGEGRYEKALAHLLQALEIAPSNVRVLVNLGNALVRTGQEKEALALYRGALSVDPEDVQARVNLGVLLGEAGETEEAMEQFRTALRTGPRSASAHYNFANLLDALGRFGEAERHYRSAVAIDPFLAHAHNNLGILLGRGGRWEEAADHYLRAIAADPAFAEAYNNLGIAFVRLGAVDAARRQFRKALQRDPGFAEAEENLRRLEAALRTAPAPPDSPPDPPSP